MNKKFEIGQEVWMCFGNEDLDINVRRIRGRITHSHPTNPPLPNYYTVKDQSGSGYNYITERALEPVSPLLVLAEIMEIDDVAAEI